MTVPTGPVADATELYRRIHPTHLVDDDEGGCVRLSSAAFKDPRMSVHLQDALGALGREPASVLEAFPQHCLAALTAGLVRQYEQEVIRSPTEEDPSHGEVVGEKRRQRRYRRLKEGAVWVVAPSNACADANWPT